MRFSLIDRITELRPGESISAIKNVSLAEEYLQDHFPGFPIIPGVLMVEALVQTGAWLMRATEEFKFSTVMLREARAVKFNNFVPPGKTLVIECTVQKRDAAEYTFKASATVEGASAVSAKIILKQFNLAEANPRLAEVDQRQVVAMQELYGVLWQPQVSTPLV